MCRLREEGRGLRGGGDWGVKGGGGGTLTEHSISQETRENKNTIYCLSLSWQNAGKCSTSHGQLLRVVTEK